MLAVASRRASSQVHRVASNMVEQAGTRDRRSGCRRVVMLRVAHADQRASCGEFFTSAGVVSNVGTCRLNSFSSNGRMPVIGLLTDTLKTIFWRRGLKQRFPHWSAILTAFDQRKIVRRVHQWDSKPSAESTNQDRKSSAESTCDRFNFVGSKTVLAASARRLPTQDVLVGSGSENASA